MKLKEHIDKFDESFDESSREPTKTPVDLFAGVEQLQREIRDKDKIIESLKKESTELTNQISKIEKEKSIILEDLKKSKWLESKLVVATKKVYDDKVKSIINENVDSKIIPVLTTVARKKQGNQQLTFESWLKIPENRYLYQINKNIAMNEFEDTNTLIGERFYNEGIQGGGGQTITTIYGLEFDGLDDHIATEFANGEDQTDRTYSFWMKASVTTKNQAVFGYGTHKKEGFTPNFGTNRPLFWGGNSWYTFWDDTPAQDDGQWHHWMIFNDVDDTEGMKMIVDGVELEFNADATSGTPGVHVQGLTIGGSKHNTADNQHAECSLTNFAVFSGDKTADASVHYNNGIPKDLSGESNLQGYWKMDEGSGTTVNDHSGNGNDGTIENGASWITMMEI
jgi:hypothetical protein